MAAVVRARIEPIDRDVRLIINEMLSPQARSTQFAESARQFIREADDTNRRALGRVPPRKVFVDGREGAPLESVRPESGVIVAEWELAADVLVWIGEELERRSPRKSGRYSKSHALYADGLLVDPGQVIPVAEKYVFVNLQPYARKIEGDQKRPPQSPRAPDGVYKVTARSASARFGNIAKITFTYDAPLTGAVFSWAHTPSARRLAHKVRRGNAALHTAWLTRNPAILVRLTGR